VPAESAQVRNVLREQDIRYISVSVRDDRIRWIHRTVKTVNLCDILPETGEATRFVPIQRDTQEAIGFLPIHAPEGREAGTREQINGQLVH
jgi:hypothetical protein